MKTPSSKSSTVCSESRTKPIVCWKRFSESVNRFENTQEYITELKNKYDSLKMICDESGLFIRSINYDNLDNEAKDIIFYQLAAARFGRDLMSFAIKWYEQFLIEMRKCDE